MTQQPQIHGRRSSFSVSKALEQLGEDLSNIKKEDRLTWADTGRVIGKSDDRAADYASAMSDMPVSAFLLGCREWNGRFANGVLGLIGMKLVEINADTVSDSHKLTRLLRLAHLLSVAINDMDTPAAVDDEELREIGSEALDEASRAIDALRIRLGRISMKAVAA